MDELTDDAARLRDERDDAVVRADMAEAELAQLLADVRVVLGVWHAAAVAGDPERLPGLDDDEAEALTAAAFWIGAGGHDINRALRNVLGLADSEPVDCT